jgi:outer membrane protein OmpU
VDCLGWVNFFEKRGKTMKKFLLATTALVGFAGAAAAEVKVGLTAEFGVSNRDGSGTQFHQGYNVKFSGSAETDGGLAFGASTRLDMDATSEENQDPKGDAGTVYISGAFGKLTMGDTDGGFDWAMAEHSFITNLTDEISTHAGFDTHSGFDGKQDDQVLRYEYKMGDLALAASYEQANNGDTTDLSDSMGLGVKYKMAMGTTSVALGLGYQTGSNGALTTSTDGSVVGGSVTASMENGLTLGLSYASYSFDSTDVSGTASTAVDFTTTGIAVAYTTGAMTVAANWGQKDLKTGTDLDGWGAGVNYDLGGGAVVQAGMYEDGYSVGLGMSF